MVKVLSDEGGKFKEDISFQDIAFDKIIVVKSDGSSYTYDKKDIKRHKVIIVRPEGSIFVYDNAVSWQVFCKSGVEIELQHTRGELYEELVRKDRLDEFIDGVMNRLSSFDEHDSTALEMSISEEADLWEEDLLKGGSNE